MELTVKDFHILARARADRMRLILGEEENVYQPTSLKAEMAELQSIIAAWEANSTYQVAHNAIMRGRAA